MHASVRELYKMANLASIPVGVVNTSVVTLVDPLQG